MASRPLIKPELIDNSTTISNSTSGSTDFVKKLFQMLEDDSYNRIVKWTSTGDSFVVLDTNEFTKEILPRHFKHSNFASFVRQLNKYDFHKVKISNEEKASYEYGEDAWEFKHPEFRVNDREALDNIKRKGPTVKKASDSTQDISNLNLEIMNLKKLNGKYLEDLRIVNTKYKTVINNIVQLKNFNERYYRSINNLVASLVNNGIKMPPLDFPNPALINLQQPNIININTIIPNSNSNPNPNSNLQSPNGVIPHLDPSFPRNASSSGSLNSAVPIQQPQVSSNNVTPIIESTGNLLFRPPDARYHVLLVEDDNVCIQLCRKFLMKYGCSVEVATDGLNAISTVEKTKYDLVLMDIVMPNLDGATATSVIRGFDKTTPIIAMTGNIGDADLVTYLQHGMSDILAKPFSKEDLYLMLEKHLIKKEDGKPDIQGPPPPPPPPPQQTLLSQTGPTGPPQSVISLSSSGNESSSSGGGGTGTVSQVVAHSTTTPIIPDGILGNAVGVGVATLSSEVIDDPMLKKQRLE